MVANSHSPVSPWPGLFLVFEGLDGSGKTTQCRWLAEHLTALGFEVVQTREPTTGPWGQQIRHSIQSGQRASAEQELDWFVRDRKQHIEELIRPSLQQGKIVLQDRYYLSTAAYQGSRGIAVQYILDLHREFAPEPDRIFLLEIPAEVGLARIQHSRQQPPDLFETLANLQQCAAIFAQLRMPTLVRMDGVQAPEWLHQQILTEIKPLISRLSPKPRH